jgi:hypothetical protein
MNEWVELSNALAMPQADVETRLEEEIDFLNESYVYVHCSLPHCEPGMLVRIWRTTYLYDLDSTAKAELVHAENITYARSGQ